MDSGSRALWRKRVPVTAVQAHTWPVSQFCSRCRSACAAPPGRAASPPSAPHRAPTYRCFVNRRTGRLRRGCSRLRRSRITATSGIRISVPDPPDEMIRRSLQPLDWATRRICSRAIPALTRPASRPKRRARTDLSFFTGAFPAFHSTRPRLPPRRPSLKLSHSAAPSSTENPRKNTTSRG